MNPSIKSFASTLAVFSLCCALLSGCAAKIPFAVHAPVSTRPLGIDKIISRHWTLRPKIYTMTHQAVFELGGKKIPLTGVMKLNAFDRSARLAAMNAVGVKAFDISVRGEDAEAHYLMPQLAGTKGFADAVGKSLAAIFLKPDPSLKDDLTITDFRYEIAGNRPEGRTVFSFGGEPPVLIEKKVKGPKEKLVVKYFEYKSIAGEWIPRGIIFDDCLAGFRLTLWLSDVKIEEPGESDE